MNREILFRGKRADNGEWVEGFYVLCEIGSNYVPIIIPLQKLVDTKMNSVFMYEVDLSTVGRYTGLTDRNGVRIFEGDKCVVTRVGVLAYGVITFCQGCFVFMETSTGKLLRLCDVKINGYEIRVQGNIHDDSELLGGETNESSIS